MSENTPYRTPKKPKCGSKSRGLVSQVGQKPTDLAPKMSVKY